MLSIEALLLTIGSVVVIASGSPEHDVRLCRADKLDLKSVDSRLRSAFLLREIRRRYPASSNRIDRSWNPTESRARLQQHFDAVLTILKANQAVALDTALRRLEQRRGEHWTSHMRRRWALYLLQQRRVQLGRLAAYCDRGLFPQNEHDRLSPVPVFVDNYGTECAVGYLMRRSGWNDAVEAIQQSNNLVHITDVVDGPLTEWIAYSGLTREEAALIQPAYDPPPFDAVLSELGQFGTISHDGLRYENFRISAKSVPRWSDGVPRPYSLPGEPLAIETDAIGVAIDDERYIDPCCENVLTTHYDDWLFFGAILFEFGYDPIITGWHAGNESEVVELIYGFDVSVDGDRGPIAGAGIYNQPIFNFNYIDGPGRATIDALIWPAISGIGDHSQLEAIASLHIDSGDDSSWIFFGDDAEGFAPESSIHVETRVILDGGAQFTSLTHSFHLVPEPTSILLCGVALAVIAGCRRRELRGILRRNDSYSN